MDESVVRATRCLLVAAKILEDKHGLLDEQGVTTEAITEASGKLQDAVEELNGVPSEIPGVFNPDWLTETISEFLWGGDLDIDSCLKSFYERLEEAKLILFYHDANEMKNRLLKEASNFESIR
jgi:hypothetical protein